MSSMRCCRRWTACSIWDTAKRRSEGSTRWSRARCSRGSMTPRSRWCASGVAFSSFPPKGRSTPRRIATMFDYEFMRTAFMAGGAVAIVAGAVGFFLVLRSLTFAGHALSHVGFAGATGAVLVGVSPLWGLLAFTLAAALAMGLLGDRLRGRDVAVGVVLSLALGLGVLFLYFYTTHATQATTILFGNVLGVDTSTLWGLLALGAVSIVALASISRPLLFATLEPDLAEAKGVSLRLIAVL